MKDSTPRRIFDIKFNSEGFLSKCNTSMTLPHVILGIEARWRNSFTTHILTCMCSRVCLQWFISWENPVAYFTPYITVNSCAFNDQSCYSISSWSSVFQITSEIWGVIACWNGRSGAQINCSCSIAPVPRIHRRIWWACWCSRHHK